MLAQLKTVVLIKEAIKRALFRLVEYLEHQRLWVRSQAQNGNPYTCDDTVVALHGYNIYRKDRNAKGGGAAVYIQNHIPVKIREDLILNTVEVIWLQIHLSHLKPILVGSCYRPPSTSSIWITCVKCLIMYVISTEKYIFWVI